MVVLFRSTQKITAQHSICSTHLVWMQNTLQNVASSWIFSKYFKYEVWSKLQKFYNGTHSPSLINSLNGVERYRIVMFKESVLVSMSRYTLCSWNDSHISNGHIIMRLGMLHRNIRIIVELHLNQLILSMPSSLVHCVPGSRDVPGTKIGHHNIINTTTVGQPFKNWLTRCYDMKNKLHLPCRVGFSGLDLSWAAAW